MKNATVSLLSQNKNIDLKSLMNHLKKENNLNISKVSFWRILYSLGFSYGRDDRNKMGLHERPDIVKRRINYLREIDDCNI